MLIEIWSLMSVCRLVVTCCTATRKKRITFLRAPSGRSPALMIMHLFDGCRDQRCFGVVCYAYLLCPLNLNEPAEPHMHTGLFSLAFTMLQWLIGYLLTDSAPALNTGETCYSKRRGGEVQII